MFVTGYEYKSACGTTIRKLIICDTQDEYNRVKKILWAKEDKGYKTLAFDEVMRSTEIKSKENI